MIERVYAEPTGRPGKCRTYAERIEAKVHLGLTAQRIYQDLVIEVGFKGSYQAIKRFVRRLKESSPTPIYRVEVQPAEEAQVDFGSGAPVNEPSGRRRKPRIFRIVLSYSRKAYSEAVWYQTTETFIRCLENAFRYFGGVPKTLNLDYVPRHIIQVLFPAQICAQPPNCFGDWARERAFRLHIFYNALSHFISSASSRQTGFRRDASEEAEDGGWHAQNALELSCTLFHRTSSPSPRATSRKFSMDTFA